MPNPSKPSRGLITASKRRRQRKRLRLRRNQLYGGYQLHTLKYGDDRCHVKSVVLRTTRYPSPA